MRWTRIGGLTALIVTLATGLALSLGLWGSWTASAQDTFIVNDDTAPAEDGCGTPDFETEDIQDAVDSGLVADGDILMICEGIYNPPNAIEVTKSLTIEGQAGAEREDVVIQGVAGSHGFDIQADVVIIRHLTLTGPGGDVAGIRTAMDNTTIQDMEISGWNDGIRIEDAEDNIIETSDIHDNTDDGVQARDGGDNVIRNNTISDNQTAVDLEAEDGDLVEGNALFENDRNQIRLDSKVNVRIERNTITTPGDGIGIVQATADSLIIIGGSAEKANTFSGPFGDPLYYVQLECDGENTVNATYNWWGSTVRTDIANRIFNDEDDMATECPAPDDVKGAVVFHPWATGSAPTPTPSPTPTATGTPTPTPGATRTIDLSPQGWHTLAWSGPDATDPATALACLSTNFSIAYMYVGTTQDWLRYVPGNTELSNMPALNKYDSLFVLISAAGVSCDMPVAS